MTNTTTLTATPADVAEAHRLRLIRERRKAAVAAMNPTERLLLGIFGWGVGE